MGGQGSFLGTRAPSSRAGGLELLCQGGWKEPRRYLTSQAPRSQQEQGTLCQGDKDRGKGVVGAECGAD